MGLFHKIIHPFRWFGSAAYNSWWKVVFFWKKQTGWIDLNQVIEVTGTVVGLVPPDLDGDMTFNVKVDPEFEKYITGFGGRLTTEDDTVGPSLHCEIEPWASAELKKTYKLLKVGDRVKVKGEHGFDGVHTGKAEWIEVLYALVRHAPNTTDGWFEVHPVAELNIINA